MRQAAIRLQLKAFGRRPINQVMRRRTSASRARVASRCCPGLSENMLSKCWWMTLLLTALGCAASLPPSAELPIDDDQLAIRAAMIAWREAGLPWSSACNDQYDRIPRRGQPAARVHAAMRPPPPACRRPALRLQHRAV